MKSEGDTMKYFTKEWYRESLNEQKEGAEGSKHRKRKKRDTTMIEYQKHLSKIENKLPDCLRITFHNNIIKSVSRDRDSLVIEFDNSNGFSDIERLYLYDAEITEEECDPAGKKWLHEEVSLGAGGFVLSALLSDDSGELYYFTVCFSHVESVYTEYTESTESGMAETLESITSLCAEEAGLDYDRPTKESLIKFLKNISTYRIVDNNLYRFESGIFNSACEEMFELIFTRQIYAKNGLYQLTISFFYPPEGELENLSDAICSDIYDDFDVYLEAVASSPSFIAAVERHIPMKSTVHAEQV